MRDATSYRTTTLVLTFFVFFAGHVFGQTCPDVPVGVTDPTIEEFPISDGGCALRSGMYIKKNKWVTLHARGTAYGRCEDCGWTCTPLPCHCAVLMTYERNVASLSLWQDVNAPPMQGVYNIGPVTFMYPATGHELDTRNSGTSGPRRWNGIWPGEYDIHFRTFAYTTNCNIYPSSSPIHTITLHVRSTLHLGEPDDGSLDGGQQLEDSLGYYHYRGQDPPGVLDAVGGEEGVIKVICDVGVVWAGSHPEVNFGVGDISLPGGGPYPGHTSTHENGRDMDVRYVRTDNGDDEVAGRLDLSDPEQRQYYDRARTLELMREFAAAACISKIYVDPRADITGADLPGIEVIVDPSGVHRHHFHIQICDPDGDDSNVCRG